MSASSWAGSVSADGSARQPGEDGARDLVDGVGLATEVAADDPALDDDRVLGDSQRAGHLGAEHEGCLVGGPDPEPTILVEPDQAAMGLEGRRVLTGGGPGSFHDERRGSEYRVDVRGTQSHGQAPLDVGMRDGLAGPAEILVGGRVRVEDGRV